MIPNTFEYHAATSVADALAMLGQYGDEAKIIAGGHSLLPMMKLRFAEPTHLIDINGIDELLGVREEGAHICIGAMTTENQLIASQLLWDKCPLIPEAAKLIADPQVRNRGTIGGDIAHGDPGNDHPAVMLALGASFVLASSSGVRTVPADEFFLGTYYTQLKEDEIMTQIQVPIPALGSGYGFSKLKRKTGDFATAAAAVQLQLDGDICSHICIAMTNVAACAFKAADAAAHLTGKIIDEVLISEASEKVMAACDPAEDLRGDIEYKTHMAGEMARRAIRSALLNAKGG